MPRDGSGVYSAPAGTTASPNTTIESSKYNAFVTDLVSDANAARPISAGGTGETSARLKDGTWRFQNTSDTTKLLAFDLSAIPTGTTRTLTIPASGKFVGTDAETFTELEKGQARANIGADVLAGFRNKLINGGLENNQRALTTYPIGTSYTYTADRWAARRHASDTFSILYTTQSSTVVDQGRGSYALRCQFSGTNGNKILRQPVEDVRTLAGKLVTLTFPVFNHGSTTAITPAIEQVFGSGGSSAVYTYSDQGSVTLAPGWTWVRCIVQVPSIAGKTIGDGSALVVYLMNNNIAGDLSFSGRISLVEGDATAEADPFSPRHIQQELALCQRYYQVGRAWYFGVRGATTDGGNVQVPFAVTMRGAPSVTIGTPFSLVDTNLAAVSAYEPNASGFGFMAKPTITTDPIRCGRSWAADAEI